MLNAELKSMNSSLTYVSVLSRCVRAGWRAVAMASSVERLDLYANWKGSREGGRKDLMCCMTSRSFSTPPSHTLIAAMGTMQDCYS